MQPTTGTRDTRRVIAAASLALLLVVVLGVYFRIDRVPPPSDSWWMSQLAGMRSPLLDSVALALDRLGGGYLGGFVVPLTVLVALLAARGPWASVAFLVATILSVAMVQLMKALVDRTRPPEMLLYSETAAYPSGHVANAATMAIVLGLLLQRTWVWALGTVYCVLMMLSRNYLGAHWLSDTVGGLLLGAVAGVLVWLAFADRVEQNRWLQPPITS